MAVLATVTKSLILDPLLSILYFPLWWYSRGLKKRALGFAQGTKALAHNLALKVMFIHIFEPMFGETSRSGRIISFFMRCIILGWRLFLFLIGTIGLLALLVIWIVLPVVAIWQIVTLLRV